MIDGTTLTDSSCGGGRRKPVGKGHRRDTCAIDKPEDRATALRINHCAGATAADDFDVVSKAQTVFYIGSLVSGCTLSATG